jgi:hypothetical protein
MPLPVELRDGYQEITDHPTVKALNKLVRECGLTGAVLVAFDGKIERLAVNSSAVDPAFARVMDELATKILQKLDDGELDPSPVN